MTNMILAIVVITILDSHPDTCEMKIIKCNKKSLKLLGKKLVLITSTKEQFRKQPVSLAIPTRTAVEYPILCQDRLWISFNG